MKVSRLGSREGFLERRRKAMGTEHSKAWQRRYQKKRRRQEAQWAARSGPVRVLAECVSCGEMLELLDVERACPVCARS